MTFRERASIACAAALLVSSSGCATNFYGAPHVEGPAECKRSCSDMKMNFAGIVAMGEYSSGCICDSGTEFQAMLPEKKQGVHSQAIVKVSQEPIPKLSLGPLAGYAFNGMPGFEYGATIGFRLASRFTLALSTLVSSTQSYLAFMSFPASNSTYVIPYLEFDYRLSGDSAGLWMGPRVGLWYNLLNYPSAPQQNATLMDGLVYGFGVGYDFRLSQKTSFGIEALGLSYAGFTASLCSTFKIGIF